MSRHTKKSGAISQTSKECYVIIIDDEQDITDLLKKTLMSLGIKVSTFNHSDTALASFKPGKYDLAIIDIRMPGMNGYQLFKRMKEIDKRLKACFLTAFEVDYEDFVRNHIEIGTINCFIKKPVKILDFTKRISALLEEIQ